MEYTDAVKTAVSYITEDAVNTFYDIGNALDHVANVVVLAVLTWGNFLFMPITALIWAVEIQKDPEGAEAAQDAKNMFYDEE